MVGICHTHTVAQSIALCNGGGMEHYVVVGMIERWEGTAGARVPGGSCWHCGTGIAYCVQIQNTMTGEQHEIGTTCAEQAGLDATALKRRRAEMRAAERWAAELERRRLQPEPELPKPEHGTADRYFDRCRCLLCIEAVARECPDEYKIQEATVIIRLATGRPVSAELVDTRWGTSWRVDNGEAWLSTGVKRRSTHANKGFVEAEAPCLVRFWRSRLPNGGTRPVQTVVCVLASPLIDVWGVAIAHPVEHASAS